MEQTTSPDLFDLQVDPRSSKFLIETAKWARFLAIVGFIFCGLIVLFSLFAGSILSAVFSRYAGSTAFLGGAFISFFYIFVSLLMFFPCLFTYRFSASMLLALRNNDQELLSTSFRNLKSLFKFHGIVTIVVLSLYGLAILFAIAGTVFR
jgi:hypothetical protein